MGDYFDYYDDKPTVCGGTTPLAERITDWRKTSRVLAWVHELIGFFALDCGL